MNFMIEGSYGNINFTSDKGTRFIEIPMQSAIIFYKQIALRYPEIALNEVGLFQLGSVGRNNKVRFASLKTPKHILQPRQNGCTWKSKGKITIDITNVNLCAVEYMGEQCPDAFWGDCLEYIFDTGRAIHDLFKTKEGQDLMISLLKEIYIGLGNSFYELAWFGQHPLIDDAETNEWYKVDRTEWVDYIDQQQTCAGWITLVDAIKEEGTRPSFNIDIPVNQVSGKKYIGSAIALLDTVFSAAPPALEGILDSNDMNSEPIVLLSEGIFDRFVEEITTKFNTVPETFYYYVNGSATADGKKLLRNVFRYKGYVLVKTNAFKAFDAITGTITHRVIMTPPSNFGLAYDIPELEQYNGMGVVVTQQLAAPFKGKVYMDTAFKMGTALIDIDSMANASLTLTPQI